jgi:hypothetical protein
MSNNAPPWSIRCQQQRYRQVDGSALKTVNGVNPDGYVKAAAMRKAGIRA